jgi:hypothetical protein
MLKHREALHYFISINNQSLIYGLGVRDRRYLIGKMNNLHWPAFQDKIFLLVC